MEPELTIVIPVFNRSGLVRRTLNSVRHQTLRPLRVVLVDNNSTDETPDVLRDWKENAECPGFEVTIVSETKPGASAARNRGLREVTTPYTMFFDSDDVMGTRHAERALKALKSPEAPDIVGWDVNYISIGGKLMRRFFYDRDMLWHAVMNGSMATQRYAARTELFRRVGGWNEADRGWDDIELGTRLLLTGPKVKKIKGAPTVTVVGLVDSITGEAFSPGAQRWEASLDHIEKALADAGHPSEAVELRRAHLAGCYMSEGAVEEGSRLLSEVKGRASSRRRRMLYGFATRYTALGGRGIARLLRRFFKI